MAVDKLTPAVLRSLDKGDILEVGRPFANMTGERLVWQVEGVAKTNCVVTFRVSLFGVSLGVVVAKPHGDKILWMEVDNGRAEH